MKKQILWGLGLALGAILNSDAQSTHYGFGTGTTGDYNSFFGAYAGNACTGSSTFKNGNSNTFIGYKAGTSTTSGFENTMLGGWAGHSNLTGDRNTFLGFTAGYNNIGNTNIFIGYRAGYNETLSSRLYIANSDDTTPLIYGDFTQDNLIFNGKVGITEEALVDQGNLFPNTAGGVSVANYQLFVRGGILTEAVRVQLETAWADYVFAPDYELPSLEAVESYIQENGHLPNMPSAEQVKSDGIELGEMAKLQQEKIEELTLYAIDQKKHIDSLEATVAKQQQEMEEMKAQINLLLEKQ